MELLLIRKEKRTARTKFETLREKFLDMREQLSSVVPTIFQFRKWRLGVTTVTSSSSSSKKMSSSKKSNSKVVSNLISAIKKAKHVEMSIFQVRAIQDSSEKIDKLVTLVSSQVNGLLLILLLNNHKKLMRLDAKANTIQRVERGRSARTMAKRYQSFKDFEQKALKVRVLFTLFHKKKNKLTMSNHTGSKGFRNASVRQTTGSE